MIAVRWHPLCRKMGLQKFQQTPTGGARERADHPIRNRETTWLRRIDQPMLTDAALMHPAIKQNSILVM
ncbi:MAG: hypothetical protein D4R40_01415 [Nitrosomonadaceae bacterium]|nr:MAG: hypothetical protein D4R40_01415 [Nitrosomonadaceae bacterium]